MIACKSCGEERRPGKFVHEATVGEHCIYCHLDWLKREHPELTKIISYFEERCGVKKCSKQLQLSDFGD